MDPGHILMDLTVEWEMCEVFGHLGRLKRIAGGDYASIMNDVTREIWVIVLESPGDRKLIKDIYAAGKCAADVEKAEFGAKTLTCVDSVNRYEVGKIMGKLFGKFFASVLKANI